MKRLLLNLACLLTLSSCIGQEFNDRSEFTINASGMERFQLYNRWGAVTVKATSGNTIKMSVKRHLEAKKSTRLEEAKKTIYMDSMMVDGELVFFIEHPFLKLQFDEERGFASYENSQWKDGWNWKDDDNVHAEFAVTLEIPARMDLVVVNHDDPLKVDGMQGDLIARNHHDGVWVKNQGGNADAHSHHGDVEVFYTKNPTKECVYDTHHGDIKIHFQPGLSADASLSSRHGDFFTEMDWSILPVKVQAQKNNEGTKYKVKASGQTSVKIGSGGPMQRFKTYHGDVYLLNK